MPDQTLRLGIDLGGSKILAVLIDQEGKVRGEVKVATPAGATYEGILACLGTVTNQVCTQVGLDEAGRRGIAAIGVGMPGPVDPDRGVIERAVNLGWTDERPIVSDLSRILGCDVVIGNDVNFGALGEVFHGAAKGARTACAAFVGTGLGGALVRDGHVVNGIHGIAGEIGHLRAPFGKARCGCGNRGCLETVCSKRGITRQLLAAHKAGKKCLISRKKLKLLKSSALKEAWKDKCPATRRAVKLAAESLAWGLAVFGAAADPEVYIVGGGVVEALGKQMLPIVSETMGDHCVFLKGKKVDVRRAVLGDYAVAIGAAVASGLKESTRW
jgi:glucokinase